MAGPSDQNWSLFTTEEEVNGNQLSAAPATRTPEPASGGYFT